MNQIYLEHVREAKESLRIWFSNVEQMHNGIQMFSKENDLDRKNSDFAKWYYGEGQTFSSFETFTVLEIFYDDMFDLFLDYTNLNNTPVKKGLFSSNAEKRKSELTGVFNNLRRAGRKLIKSVDIFEEKLVKSPLFDNSIELSFDTNSDASELDSVVEHKKEETQLDLSVDIDEKSDDEVSKTVTDTSEVNFEKRLQEEVAKIKKQLEEEFVDNQDNISSKSTKVENTESIADSETKSKVNPKLKSGNKKTPDIDLDEEIRRILS